LKTEGAVGDRARLIDHQLAQLRLGLQRILTGNSSVAEKIRRAGLHAAEGVRTLDDLAHLPVSSREELLADQADTPPFGTHLAKPIAAYVRVSESAGTTGAPLRWLDTPADVEWLTQLWRTTLTAVGLRPGDRVLHAAHAPQLGRLEGSDRLPVLSLDAPTLQTATRALAQHAPTVVLSTPSAALSLSDHAPSRALRLAVLCGEPGGSVPSTRRRIEERLGVACADLYWLTELGPVGWDCSAQAGVHLNEDGFIVEAIGLGNDAGDDLVELVLTTLGRWGMPAIRYRTGDIVRLRRDACACGSGYARADGGVLGRLEDLLDVRGTLVLPSMVENVVRRHPAVLDYRLHAYDVRGACEVAVEIEPDAAIATEGDRARVAAEVSEDLRRSLGLRLQCEAVASGSLPRDEPRPQRVDRRRRKTVAS